MVGKSWAQTSGADVNVEVSAQNGTFIKCEELEDRPFTIYDFSFEESVFDLKKEQVRIKLTLDDEEDSEDNDYTLTTTQSGIMDQLKKSEPDELPYLDCTLFRPFDRPNRWGNWSYAIGPYAKPIKKNGFVHRDVREDNSRQAVKSSPVRTPVRTTPKR